MGVVHSSDVVVDADYSQFYARRVGAEWASDRVSDLGYEEHLWSNGSFIYVGTHRQFGPTHVAVEVLDAGPHGEPDPRWQHVAEVSLDEGGDLEIHGWELGAELIVPIDPGAVRLRVHWAGLEADSLEFAEEESDPQELLFQVWPARPAASQVIRWWDGWLLPPRSVTSPEGLRQIEGYDAMVPKLAGCASVADLLGSGVEQQMPGGGEHSRVYAVLFDPADQSWWVDGHDVRRTLREVSEADAARLAQLERPPS